MSGNRIKYWRKERGMSQLELGFAIGGNQTTARNLENGSQKLTVEYIEKLARALDVAPVDILPESMVREEGSAYTVPPPSRYIPPKKPSNRPDIVQIALMDDPNRSCWTLPGNDLAAMGARKGDVVIVDASVLPKDGDIVLAQRYTAGTAESCFRVLKKPFLMTAPVSGEPDKPIIFDGENAAIIGTVTDLWRKRAS